jgi:sugar-specific transcriptional regulator TrmB
VETLEDLLKKMEELQVRLHQLQAEAEALEQAEAEPPVSLVNRLETLQREAVRLIRRAMRRS